MLARDRCPDGRVEGLSRGRRSSPRTISEGELLMGIAIWIIVILVIAALIKYLMSDSGKK